MIDRKRRQPAWNLVRPYPPDEVTLHAVQHEAVAYDAERNVAYSLNVSARAIWELCDGTRTARDIAAHLATMVHEPFEQLETDVINTLMQFRELGIVSWSEADGDTISLS